MFARILIIIKQNNLKKQKNALRVLDELRNAVRDDPVKTQVVDMTKLGLVEMTRKKIDLPLRNAVFRQTGKESGKEMI